MNMDLWNSKVGVHFFTSCLVSIVRIVLFDCLSLGMFKIEGVSETIIGK